MVSIASAGLAVVALVFAPHSMTVLNMVPRDALQVVGTSGITGAIGALIAALATGLRARSSPIPRPVGFPADHCAEVPRLINAFNVLKETAQRPNQIEEGAEQFAVDLYLKAVGRKAIDAESPMPKKAAIEPLSAAETVQDKRNSKIDQLAIKYTSQSAQQSQTTSAGGTPSAESQLPANLLAPRPVKPRSQPTGPYAKPQPPPVKQDAEKDKPSSPPSDKSGGQSKPKREPK